MDYLVTNPLVAEIQKNFILYREKIYPFVANICTQKKNGMHGLDTHTAAVVFRGIDYALSLNENPWPVIFACACHDMARTHDGFDLKHGINAVPMATKIIQKFDIDEKTMQSILFAIANHTTGTKAPDYISACLWDADRTRLSWEYGYKPNYFNTQRAKQIASSNCDKYVTFQKKCFPDLIWEKTY